MEPTKPNKFRNLKHVAALSSAHVVMALCGLVTNVIWARWIPQEVFGGFKVILTLVNLIGTLCLLGAGQAALISAANNADGNFGRLVRAKLLANFGGSVLLLTAAGYYAYAEGASLPIAFGLLATALLFPTYNISDVWTSWLNGGARFRDLAIGRMLLSLLPLSSVAIVAALGISELWHVAALYFTLTGIQNVVMLKRIAVLRSNTTFDEGILTLGRHTTVAMMFGSFVALDVVILNYYFSVTEVAVYAVAQVLPELIRSLLAVLNQLFAPTLYAGQPLAALWRNIKKQFQILTGGLVTLGVGGFFLLPEVVPLLFSEKYTEAADYSKWLWLVMASFGSFGLLGNALLGTRKLVFTYGAFVGYPVLLCALYFVFAKHGVAGMVTARGIAIAALHLFYAFGFLLSITTADADASLR